MFCEDGTGFRFFHIAFTADHAFPVHFGEERVQQGQRVQIVGLAAGRVSEDALEALQDQPHGVLCLRGDESAQGRAKDDDEFAGLNQNKQVPARKNVPADDGPDDNDEADDD